MCAVGGERGWRGAGRRGAEGEGREDGSAARITWRRNGERCVASRTLVNMQEHAGNCKPTQCTCRDMQANATHDMELCMSGTHDDLMGRGQHVPSSAHAAIGPDLALLHVVWPGVCASAHDLRSFHSPVHVDQGVQAGGGAAAGVSCRHHGECRRLGGPSPVTRADGSATKADAVRGGPKRRGFSLPWG